MILQSMILPIPVFDKMNRISENNSAYAAQPPCLSATESAALQRALLKKNAVSCVLERKI